MGEKKKVEMGQWRNLVAPPVNLRVWVVASIAVTGVEVAETTWEEGNRTEKSVEVKVFSRSKSKKLVGQNCGWLLEMLLHS